MFVVTKFPRLNNNAVADSGEGPGVPGFSPPPPPSLLLDETEARWANKNFFFGDRAPSLSQDLDDRAPSHPSYSLI